MNNNISEIVEKMYSLPSELTSNKEYLVLPKEYIDKLLNSRRKQIIHLLWEQNPITEKKLSELFGYDVRNDIAILNHVGLVNVQKIDDDNKHNIITLNRKLNVI